MVTFIDDHREAYGGEPICTVLPIAPATYFAHRACQADPRLQSRRAQRDAWLQAQIRRVWDANYGVYGARKVWRQLTREGITVARCTVERLMRAMGLQGVVRGRRYKTTIPDNAASRPSDLVNREFTPTRPNALWVADPIYRGSSSERTPPYRPTERSTLDWYLEPWKKYGVFTGRARRKEFLVFPLGNPILYVALCFFSEGVPEEIITKVVGLFYLVGLVPSLAVGVRRMHDSNHSGWLVIVPHR